MFLYMSERKDTYLNEFMHENNLLYEEIEFEIFKLKNKYRILQLNGAIEKIIDNYEKKYSNMIKTKQKIIDRLSKKLESLYKQFQENKNIKQSTITNEMFEVYDATNKKMIQFEQEYQKIINFIDQLKPKDAIIENNEPLYKQIFNKIKNIFSCNYCVKYALTNNKQNELNL